VVCLSTVQQAEGLRSTSSSVFAPQRSFTRSHTKIITIRTGKRSIDHLYNFGHSASRTDADIETDTDRNTINIQRKSCGAPVVDSTLLRFISQQKQIPGVFLEDDDEDGSNSVFVTTPPSVASVLSSVEAQQQLLGEEFRPSIGSGSDPTTDAIKKKLASSFTFSEDNSDEIDTDFVLDNTLANTDSSLSSSSRSWMTQFGSKNVAQFLLAKGDVTDEASARTAGDAVERYCVVRTARRRIRRFLRERDTLWAAGSSGSSSSSRSELESLAALDMASSPAASLLLSYAEQRERQRSTVDEDDDGFAPEEKPSYGLEDVLEVMSDYGLTGNDICVLLTHSPNLALRVPRKSFLKEGQTDEAETLEETLERSLKGLLMSTLGLRRYDARKVLRTCPGLLSVRGSKSAIEVVTIMTKLGVSESSLARDKNSLPVLLSRSPSGLFRLVAFLSSTAIRMPLKQVGPLLRRKIGRDLMDALLPVPNTSYSKMVVTAASANANANEVVEGEAATTLEDDAATWSQTRIERQERIERTYSCMSQTARILKAQIGTQDLTKVVSAYPNVLLLDAEKQILPVARYMMGGLGIWQNDLSGVLQLYPTILGTKIEDLERVVSYVLALGVDEDDLAGIFRAFPGLFALPIDSMESVVYYLKSIGVEDIGAFVTKLPPVLGYSVEEELSPKWEFLKTVSLQPAFELKEFPAYFSYPFARVIKTRFNYLAFKGISIRFVSMRIDTVLRFGDVDFATKVALDDDRGEVFRAFTKQRGSSCADGAAAKAQKLKKKKPHRNRNEDRAALAAAQRFSEDIDNATNLAELNRIFREATPLRNRSLGNSLPSLSPSRPKRKQNNKGKQENQKQNQNQQNSQQQKQQSNHNYGNRNNNQGGDENIFPCPA